MRKRFLKSVISCFAAQSVLSALIPAVALANGAIGTPGGPNRNPIDFRAGTPFANSTWTPSHNAHIPGIANGAGLAKHGFALDLSSTSPTIVLGPKIGIRATAITINVGGTNFTFHRNDAVTPAEFVAIRQVLTRGGSQTIDIDTNGAAIGGTFTFNRLLSPRITGLVIPSGVTAIDNFARNPLLGISGDLVNSGTIYGYTSSARIHTGLLYAPNIINNVGGLISTQLPQAFLPDSAHMQPAANLVLAAIYDIRNSGVILSSGDLKLATAYGNIVNALSTGVTGPASLMQAAGNVKLLPGTTGTVTNYGNVVASNGNITINSPVNTVDITVNGTQATPGGNIVGVFQAFNGSIDIRPTLYCGPSSIILNGGEYDATKGLNLHGGYGNVFAGNPENTTAPIFAPILGAHAGQQIKIDDATTSGIILTESAAGGSFSLHTAGPTTLSNILTGNGSITVSADTGLLQTIPGALLAANIDRARHAARYLTAYFRYINIIPAIDVVQNPIHNSTSNKLRKKQRWPSRRYNA
jgi:hypothetical protein